MILSMTPTQTIMCTDLPWRSCLKGDSKKKKKKSDSNSAGLGRSQNAPFLGSPQLMCVPLISGPHSE